MLEKIKNIPILGNWLIPDDEVSGRIYRGIHSIRRRAPLPFFLMRALFRAIARTQHAEITAIGLENIPADGPVMLVGNHPNSLLDFFNLLAVIRHPVATAAKDTITGLPVIGPLLRKALMVPLARKQDQDLSGLPEAERVKANQEAVREAVEMLARGRIFNIFGEGKSTDSRKLQKIKLGFMAIAIAAEKEFNFNLNLKIVPYGFFYDRINKFQSSVCLIFHRPVLLRQLIERPDNALALSPEDWTGLEKKLLAAGKEHVQRAIEETIISIPEPSRIDLIDDCVALYALSPVKYMGPYANIKEKYIISKQIADAVLRANVSREGRERLTDLQGLLARYRQDLKKSRVKDALIRRETSASAWGYHFLCLCRGLMLLPLALPGYLANFLPRQAGRFMRFYTIEVRKQAKVDGDEKAIVAAFAAVILAYPLQAGLIFYFTQLFLPLTPSIAIALASLYLMGRLWRTSLYAGNQWRRVFHFIHDGLSELLWRKRIGTLRQFRYQLIDSIDRLLIDYSP